MSELLKQIDKSEKEIINSLYELEVLKNSLLYIENDLLKIRNGETMMEEQNVEKIAPQIPFVAYEYQAERFQEEKEQIRKHYKHIILGLCAVLASLIIGIFGTVIYIMDNYDFGVYEQYITTGDSGTATIEDGIHNTNTK